MKQTSGIEFLKDPANAEIIKILLLRKGYSEDEAEKYTQALQDPLSRFVFLSVFRVRKFIRVITFGRWCRI